MKTTKSFAELRCRMIRCDVCQKDLAATAGIADATMTDRMAGRSYFRADEIMKIATRLNIAKEDYYQFSFAAENYPRKPAHQHSVGR